MNDSYASRLAFKAKGCHACLWVASALMTLAAAAPSAPGREPKILSQFYLVNDPPSLASLQKNFAKISLVCPQWLSVSETGDLESTVDSSVVDWAAGKGVLLMPILVNKKFLPTVAHTVLGDEAIQSKLINRMIEMAKANHFFGIQFDFENIPDEDRDRYSHLIRNAAKEFRREHLKVSVAVVPPFAPPPVVSPLAPPATTGWITNPHSAAYDYRRLADEAFFISLMTYDEYASPQQPGPVAGAPWVEACLLKTLESVSAKKLLLGVPLYYREWSGNSIQEGSIQEALALAARWKAQIEIDSDQKEAFFNFNDGSQQHLVWLQDVKSLHERLDLVARYHLAGFSAWRLGFEDPQAWQEIFPEVIKKIH
ncbi:MAG TPA: glycosyl hydrolase family 18 protein [Terriglobia bacterium]|nr:glycosyl hydrolase family 18 protein [Terriglobia bacterium]